MLSKIFHADAKRALVRLRPTHRCHADVSAAGFGRHRGRRAALVAYDGRAPGASPRAVRVSRHVRARTGRAVRPTFGGGGSPRRATGHGE
jgi:hypothetical protein